VIYEAIGHCFDKLKNYAQARFHYRKATHLAPEDSKLHYKVACTYYNEEQWQSAVKSLDAALKINRQQQEYNLLMGECKLKLGAVKEAIQYFSAAVRIKPKNMAGWEALIRCLYQQEFYTEARAQCMAALEHTGNKPLFLYYLTAILLALGKTKAALLYLAQALAAAPKTLRKLIALNPSLLQNSQVVDVIAQHKRR
jgi:tetratricopeptide (TPR) repeat protein